MKSLVFAVLSTFSLAACAQPANPQADGGQKIGVGGSTPAATKPLAEPAFAEGSPEARVRDVLKQLNPKIRVDRIGVAPIPGFREVVAGGQVVYVSDDGKYLFQGGLLDVAKRKDMSESALARVRADVLKTLPMADRIVYSPVGAAKHKVVVLTDVECGYCRKFHNDLAEYTKRGIEVQYLAFPRAGLGSPDYRKMVSVWCADDRRKALTDAKNDRAVPPRTCKTPVDMQYNAGLRMGLEGTPMLLTTDGEFLGGYLPPDVLLQRMQQVEAERAAEGA
ncbi:MAG TPA: DsbC family protein [Thermomonas sp.]|nr:DsbC family protein [Thermomonas sp.]